MSSVGTVFLWDRKVARKGEESSDYLASLETIAEVALKSTVRMEWDNANRCYKFEYATADLGEPDWPADRTMADWTRLAFRDRNINREDHPVVVEYRTGKPAA
jgi:hypothetical protein